MFVKHFYAAIQKNAIISGDFQKIPYIVGEGYKERYSITFACSFKCLLHD